MSALQAIKRFRIRELAALPKLDTTAASGPAKVRNPFLPFKNPETGRWAPPKYSLRRQAELVKKARLTDTLHLLPPGLKYVSEAALKALEAEAKAAEAAAKAGPQAKPVVQAKPKAKAAAKAKAKTAPVLHRKLQWRRNDVVWVGKFKPKEVPGMLIGNRLYAGKRRMFKGHKWERTREKREERRKMLMRGMAKRIERFKTHYRKKRPNPISVPRHTNYTKLPF